MRRTLFLVCGLAACAFDGAEPRTSGRGRLLPDVGAPAPRDAGSLDADPLDAEPLDVRDADPFEDLDAEPADAEPPDALDASIPVPSEPDAGPVDAGRAEPWLDVGTGAMTYEPLVEGQVVPLTTGAQGGGRFGGLHVFVGLRTRGVAPSDARVDVTVRHGPSGRLLAELVRQLDLVPRAGAFEAAGFPLILADCCLADGLPLDVEVTVTDRAGVRVVGARRVYGAEGACADHTGASYCR